MSQQAAPYKRPNLLFYLFLAALCTSAFARDRLGESGYPTRIEPGTVFNLNDPLARQQRTDYLHVNTIKAKTLAERMAKRAGLTTSGATQSGRYELMELSGGFPIYYVTCNNNAAKKIGVTALRADPNLLDPDTIDGSGLIVGIWDNGWVRVDHNEFVAGSKARIMDGPLDSNGYPVDPLTLPFDNHATHMAGTIGAAGNNPAARGMAPAVFIDSYNWEADVAEMTARGAASPGGTDNLLVSCHSYGVLAGWEIGKFHDPCGVDAPHWFGIRPERTDRKFGYYDGRAAAYDQVVYSAPYFLPFKAAGNDRDDNAPADGAQFWYLEPAWAEESPLPYNLVGYAIIAKNWLLQGSAIQDKNADINDDNRVNEDDLQILIDYWLTAGPGYDPNGALVWNWVPDVYDAADLSYPRGDGDPNGFDTIPTFGCAKNIVTVGAIDDVNLPTAFSGFGPTDDGRIKPDIVADGNSLYSSLAGDPNDYGYLSGTSQAAASAAGAAALLVQYYNDLGFENESMRASTLKALIIHTANNLTADPGPNYMHGWGLMDVNEAAEYVTTDYKYLTDIRGPSDPNGIRIIEGVLAPDSNNVYKLKFESDNTFLKATLCWTDPPGQPILRSPDVDDANGINGVFDVNDGVLDNNSIRLVNDLDLRIIDPCGPTMHLPYILDPCNPGSPAAVGDNIRDNVEQVVMLNPVKGVIYEISISHKGNLANGLQHYSLILSEPIPVRNIWVDDDAGSDPFPHLSDDAHVETGERALPFDSIQQAIDDAIARSNADAGVGINIVRILDGTYTGDGNYNIDTRGKDLTVKSENGAANCIVDCQAATGRRGFNIHAGETSMTVIRGLSIQNGRVPDYGGGIYCTNESSPWIDNCNVYLCWADDAGGGIACDANSSPLITECVVAGNFGGYFNISDPNIMGGGIYCKNAEPAIIDSAISFNEAEGAGGGIALRDCNAVIINSVIYRNKCVATSDVVEEYGGGICCRGGNTIIYNSLIEDNTAADSGGGITVSDGPAIWDINDVNDVNDVTLIIDGNDIADANVTWIIGCKVAHNDCQASGGGIYSEGMYARTFVQNTLIANNFGYWSGGMSSNYGSVAFLYNVTISDNDAAYAYLSTSRIGGMECDYGTAVIANSIIYGNRGEQLTGYKGMSYNGKSYYDIDDIDDPNYDPDEPNDPNIGFVNYAMLDYSDIGMVDANGQPDHGAAWPGVCNINVDPLFAIPTVWGGDPYDYHLQTEYPNGRFNPVTGLFDLTDLATSPCIDAGDPRSDYSFEPAPNGERVNMGAFGNTWQASMSP